VAGIAAHRTHRAASDNGSRHAAASCIFSACGHQIVAQHSCSAPGHRGSALRSTRLASSRWGASSAEQGAQPTAAANGDVSNGVQHLRGAVTWYAGGRRCHLRAWQTGDQMTRRASALLLHSHLLRAAPPRAAAARTSPRCALQRERGVGRSLIIGNICVGHHRVFIAHLRAASALSRDISSGFDVRAAWRVCWARRHCRYLAYRTRAGNGSAKHRAVATKNVHKNRRRRI